MHLIVFARSNFTRYLDQQNMKSKARTFIFSFGLYCLIFLTWHGWTVTGKQVAEMIFVGILLSMLHAFTMRVADIRTRYKQ